MKAAAEVVPDAAGPHRVERLAHARAGPPREGARRGTSCSGTWGAARSRRCSSSKRADELARRAFERVRRDGAAGCDITGRDAPDRLRQLFGLRAHLVGSRAVRLPYRLEHLRETRHPVAVDGREVRAGEEGPLVGGQKDGQRPAAASTHQLHDELVNLVEIGSLLAIDLHADEPLVHDAGGRLVLERLALHDVAPVARRVPDAKEDRLVLALRPVERFGAPRIPVDGVLRVLLQIRRRLTSQSVRHGGSRNLV